MTTIVLKYRSKAFNIIFPRFGDLKNIHFNTKIMILYKVIIEILMFIEFDGGHFEKWPIGCKIWV